MDIKNRYNYKGNSSDAVYGLGLVGALVYYISHATSLLMGIIGFFKALVWPAFVVYHVLEFLLK
jgi:hypothetical protein